jgi:hypothetical protein
MAFNMVNSTPFSTPLWRLYKGELLVPHTSQLLIVDTLPNDLWERQGEESAVFVHALVVAERLRI